MSRIRFRKQIATDMEKSITNIMNINIADILLNLYNTIWNINPKILLQEDEHSMYLKKIAIVMALVVTLMIGTSSLSLASYYDGGNPTTQENINIMCAYTLHDIGLFQGTDNGFELNNKATRLQGVVMFIRILGQESAVSAGGSNTTFTDVPVWGKAYTAYAEQQGLSNGLGNGKFGSDNLMTAKDYATFLLRGLGYSDSNGDFSYDNSVEYLNKIGTITNEELDYLKTSDFRRGEMALMSYRALCSELKGTKTPLVEKLGLGYVLVADYTGMKNEAGECGFQIQFDNLSKIKGASQIISGPLGYKFPIDNCFVYRQLSKDYGKKIYNTIDSLDTMSFGVFSDDGTEGQYTHGFVLCDSSKNELALLRLYASQENQQKHKEKFISTAFPEKYSGPIAIKEGISYDKSSGIATLDKQIITNQIGNYTKIYSSWINWTLDDTGGFLPETVVDAMNGRNGIKTYNGDVSSINVDPSKYYHVLLFMDSDGNPVGCKTLEK